MTKICAILNYTPNSFSDGNKYSSQEAVISTCKSMFIDGADIVDIGVQSTTYGAVQDPPQKEWEKLYPILKGCREILSNDLMPLLSIDTYNYYTASRAIDFGIGYINDVSGGIDSRLLELIAANPNVKYICMFSLCIPADKNHRISRVDEIYTWCNDSVKRLTEKGIKENQIILDPGIGFSTNPDQSFAVIKNCHLLRNYGVEVMIGHSRKSFLENITHLPPHERDLETTVASLYMHGKVDYLRVHNPSMHFRAFGTWEKINKSYKSEFGTI